MASNLRLAARLFGKLSYSVRGLQFARAFRSKVRPDGASLERETNPLFGIAESKARRPLWKFDHYFPVYHRHFSKFVGKPVNVLEIGVLGGGSLELWREYFGPDATIYGVDIDQTCKQYEDARTRIFIGDQEDRAFWARVRDSIPRIDIVIDDGGHRAEQQIATLEELLPHLAPGGVYLCEDIHGEHHGFGAYLYGLARDMNAMRQDAPLEFQSWIRSVNIYPYVAVLEKAETPAQSFPAPRRRFS